MMMNNRGFHKFGRITHFTYFESIILYTYKHLIAEHIYCLKGLKISMFGSYERFLLLRLNGHVGTIPTYHVYRVYGLYDNNK